MSNVKTVNGYKVADGDLRNNVAPEFDQSNAYNVGDIVFHENQLYKCTTATTADADWNSTQWSTTNLAEMIKTLTKSAIRIADVSGITQTPVIDISLYSELIVTLIYKSDEMTEFILTMRVNPAYISDSYTYLIPMTGFYEPDELTISFNAYLLFFRNKRLELGDAVHNGVGVTSKCRVIVDGIPK